LIKIGIDGKIGSKPFTHLVSGVVEMVLLVIQPHMVGQGEKNQQPADSSLHPHTLHAHARYLPLHFCPETSTPAE